jgi:hypothetical protein
VTAVCLLAAPLVGYLLYNRAQSGTAERATLGIAELFAGRASRSGPVTPASVNEADVSLAEAWVFSSVRTRDTVTVSLGASAEKGSPLGTSPFTRCYSITFTGSRYSIAPLPECEYETG